MIIIPGKHRREPVGGLRSDAAKSVKRSDHNACRGRAARRRRAERKAATWRRDAR